MKDFITPEIEDISELTEGVYADSASGKPFASPTPVPTGTVPNPTATPTPAATATPTPAATATQVPDGGSFAYWEDHNSGTHSVIRIHVMRTPDSGNRISGTVVFNGIGAIILKYPGEFGKSLSGNVISFCRNNHFNAGEELDFNIGTYIFPDSPHNEKKGAYYPSGTNKGLIEGRTGDLGLSISFE